MDLINILKVIYQKKEIKDIYEYPFPYIVLKWLSMNPTLNKEVNYLNRYAFILDEEQFFKLCYCIVPKQNFRFYKYIKTKKEIEHLYEPLIIRYRERFKMADNDYSAIDNILITNIENNMLEWLKMAAIPEKQYKKFGAIIPEVIKKEEIKSSLNKWF